MHYCRPLLPSECFEVFVGLGPSFFSVSEMSCRCFTISTVVHHGTTENVRTVGARVEIGRFEFPVERHGQYVPKTDETEKLMTMTH